MTKITTPSTPPKNLRSKYEEERHRIFIPKGLSIYFSDKEKKRRKNGTKPLIKVFKRL